MGNLSDNDRRALRLADNLQKAVEQWLSYRPANQACTVSPFVDPAGQPAVIIKLNADMAAAVIDSLSKRHSGSAGPPGPASTPGYVPSTRRP